MITAAALLAAALGSALTDPVPLNPNTLDPLAHRPRVMIGHTFKFASPMIKPALPRGAAR